MHTITSKQNPEIKNIRSLYNPKKRKKEKKFVIEGVKILQEALLSNFEILKIFYSSSFAKKSIGKNILSEVISRRIKLTEVEPNIFKYISSLETPEGILAIIKQKEFNIEEVNFDKNSIFVVLDRIQDPGNIGTIIRCADAVDIKGVIFTNNCCDIYNSKVIKASAGSIFHIPFFEIAEENLFKYLEKNKINIVLSSPKGKLEYSHFKFTLPIALVLGNESHGISKKISDAAKNSIKIPIYGKAESLNVAVSAGILLYEIARQREVAV